MKKTLLCTLLLLPLLAFAQPEIKQYDPLFRPKPSKKTYIDSSRILLKENQIFVEFEDEYFPVDAIHADTNGYFVQPPYFDYDWTCRVCKELNGFYRSGCKNPSCEGLRPPKYRTL